MTKIEQWLSARAGRVIAKLATDESSRRKML